MDDIFSILDGKGKGPNMEVKDNVISNLLTNG
nr:MAG TPA: hypothetical protein [Crassvirales sp.]